MVHNRFDRFSQFVVPDGINLVQRRERDALPVWKPLINIGAGDDPEFPLPEVKYRSLVSSLLGPSVLQAENVAVGIPHRSDGQFVLSRVVCPLLRDVEANLRQFAVSPGLEIGRRFHFDTFAFIPKVEGVPFTPRLSRNSQRARDDELGEH